MNLYIRNPENVELPSKNSVNIFIDSSNSTLKGKKSNGEILEFSKTIEADPDFSSMGITVSSSDVKTGKYFIDSTGTLQQGSLNESSVTTSSNQVTLTNGFIDEAQTIQVGTLYSGSNELTPGTEDQTIVANTYLSNQVVIKGDSNLLAENIKSGVVIFGITGTYDGECEGGSDSGDSGESGSSTDIVSLLNLPRPISEYTSEHLGEIISVPYTDESGTITGPIEFEVVGVNHHKEVNDESLPTISLMCTKGFAPYAFDVKEPNNPDSNRASHGNNRWSVSNIRQWLNSEGAAGGWYTPQHEDDAEPSYSNRPGFLTGISDDIKQYLATVRNITALNTVSDGGGSETTDDKVFLPSRTEIKGVANGDSIMEGSKLTYANINRGMVFARSAVTSSTVVVGVWDDCPGLGDYTSSYRADTSLKIAPIIVLRGSVIEDNSGGDGSQTAVYRVSGCSMNDFNGDYYLTEYTSLQDKPVWVNDNEVYLYLGDDGSMPCWGFSKKGFYPNAPMPSIYCPGSSFTVGNPEDSNNWYNYDADMNETSMVLTKL